MKNTFYRWARSLSAKVIAMFFIATLALLAVLWLTLGMTFKKLLSDNLEPYLTSHLISLQSQVGMPPNIDVAKKLAKKYPVIIEIDAPAYRWSSSETFIERENFDVRLQRLNTNQTVASEAGFYNDDFILRTFERGYIVSFIITEKLGNTGVKAMRIAIGAIVLILGVLLSCISWLFKPVKVIEKGIRRMGDGEVSHRLSINRNDELGALSHSINKTADNVEGMLNSKRQLLLAISHELRTPITRAKLALSMLDDEMIKESISEDMNEMEALIEELLESERMRESHASLECYCVDVNEIIYQVQGRFFEDTPLTLNLGDLPKINIDPKRIGLAIKNVIKNAITASPPNSPIVVNTCIDGEFLVVDISDLGTGVSPEDLPRLTEPFFRPDSSRQRKTGGFGIGLYLIKEIMIAHDGKLQIESELGQGTTVRLLLPLSPTQADG